MEDEDIIEEKPEMKRSLSQLYPSLVAKPNSPYPLYRANSPLPIILSGLGLGIVTAASYLISDKYFPKITMEKNIKHGSFLLGYFFTIFALRIRDCGTPVAFESLWGCNASMVMSAIGCIVGKPLMISSSLALVALDQFSFLFDIICYLLFKVCPLGAAQYLFSGDQTFIRNLTSLHHLWFLPYGMMILKMNNKKYHEKSWQVSMIVGSLLILFGRFLAPKYIWFPISKGNSKDIANTLGIIFKKMKSSERLAPDEEFVKVNEQSTHYLALCNINCSHQFDPNIKIPFFHLMDGKPFVWYFPYMVLVSGLLNCLPSLVLIQISKKFIENSNK